MGGVLICNLVSHELDWPASLLLSCWCWWVGRERLRWPHLLWFTQQYHLASMVPGIPSQTFPTTISSLTYHQSVFLQLTAARGLLQNPQTPASSCYVLYRTRIPVWGVYGFRKTVWFSFQLGCHRSAVSLSLQCFLSDPDNYSNVGIGHLLQSSHILRAVTVLLTLVFFHLVPLSYRVLW